VDDRIPTDAMALPSAPVVLLASATPQRRQFTGRHAELLDDPRLREGRDWAAIALWSCLEHLRVSGVTEAGRVAVVDAWLDGPDAFCVLYRPPFAEAWVVGLRRCRQEVLETREWRLGDMTTWGYDMGSNAKSSGGAGDFVDPVAFGWNVADFDIGEPLGFVATILRYGRGDIGWWGSLGVEPPEPPELAE
jgi:hypothetical protein